MCRAVCNKAWDAKITFILVYLYLSFDKGISVEGTAKA